MTTWSPDTCECVIEDYLGPAPVFIQRCKRHGAASALDVLGENQHKNRTVAPLVVANLPFNAYFDEQGKLNIQTFDQAAADLLAGSDANVVTVSEAPPPETL